MLSLFQVTVVCLALLSYLFYLLFKLTDLKLCVFLNTLDQSIRFFFFTQKLLLSLSQFCLQVLIIQVKSIMLDDQLTIFLGVSCLFVFLVFQIFELIFELLNSSLQKNYFTLSFSDLVFKVIKAFSSPLYFAVVLIFQFNSHIFQVAFMFTQYLCFLVFIALLGLMEQTKELC